MANANITLSSKSVDKALRNNVDCVKALAFVKHIKEHLKEDIVLKDQKVVCKICNKDIDEIYESVGFRMKKTKVNFKLTLNNWYNARYQRSIGGYGNRIRGFGAFLYTHDKVKFDLLFDSWLPSMNKEQFEEVQ